MVKLPAVARTAIGPIAIAAIEQHVPANQRLVRDDLAVRMLPRRVRLVVGMCRWRPVREWLAGLVNRSAPGLWGSMLCRKRYADDQVSAAVQARINQVVVLGSGFDTRARRLVVPAGASAFEVDLPASIDHKRKVTRDRGPAGVRLVAVDFRTDDLAECLAAAGFRMDEPAMVVWEAVTQYLTEDGVRRTLASLGRLPAGSRLIFTYIRADFLDGRELYGAGALRRWFVTRQRLWHFGIAPEDVDGLLREYGWVEREQVGPTEYQHRYVRPAARELPTSEIERFVYAVKP
ncbi:class I SAM-dependent methyltransferase [Kibdelosporangium phytohabitans]|uniref:S-adenosyl-L-methionine-dependent methyltransferase n=1 Tax=Kibdelosporangium phytohabitans TaxID=860235 RepID=A0A0N9I693_9PSEU|nr:SAM-dependent methyltransferase [Kibdelosporangium phytohabitans]ALG10408.1 methyltransferase [Kibdelosporangium phytohabitans]MBE1461471.1 methyltransferase (TIGR00027 family) [Kibdelosporangium phytohabitans]